MASENRKKKKANTLPKTGVCALLGVEGTYAKSHLIPLSLTSPSIKGERFIESGRGSRPIRRFTSWYDQQLVSRDGEKILSEIDTAGIEELRRHKLIWSGWEGREKLKLTDYAVPPEQGSSMGVRLLDGVNSEKLRLFFLSILWRSLKTTIKEFSYLPNNGVDLERIGRMIVEKNSGHFGYHPIVLDQMSTLGFCHNYTPTLQKMDLEFEEGTRSVEFYRLYMQGLVVHIYPESCPDLLERMAALFIGGMKSCGFLLVNLNLRSSSKRQSMKF
ncbi:hypothetical protein IMF27_28160 [Pseudomonas sp. PCH199]|uniref:hypothetical protein n=1 Tax=unclassified Pseudomonas TaxID=196821 RepID=UPI000BCE82E7|nr:MULTISPECIES: hypothetical protein [unclassified Pseudomonas]MCW8278909.1 hypothetical protein [Pseudomonas sp. PCH199]PAM79741.1 hypothetical protein CES87_28815 [Pseudomonas sp. ERMR1:02]